MIREVCVLNQARGFKLNKERAGKVAKRQRLTEQQLNSLQSEILGVYRIPMCLTEGLSVGFVLDLVNVFSTDEEWLKLDAMTQRNMINKVMEKLESEGKLTSKMVKVGTRHFDDDEDAPKLPKRVRVFHTVR